MGSNLSNILDTFQHKRILVIGDLYLDEYKHVVSKGVSPEHPVLRTVVQSTNHEAGAAGFVSSCFHALGASTAILAIVGKGPFGDILINCLQSQGINTQMVIRDNNPTGVFSRLMIYDNGVENHVIRIDHEVKSPSPETRDRLFHLLENNIQRYDAIFFADYNENPQEGIITKSLIDKVLLLNEEHNKLLVGISRLHPEIFHNFDLVILNEHEAKNLIQSKNQTLDEACVKEIQEKLNLKYLVITKGRDGVAACHNSEFVSMHSFAKKVVDVCGAGDSFSSAFTLAILSKATLEEAAKIGNVSAAVCIGKTGIGRNTKIDEIHEFLETHSKAKRKIVNSEEIIQIRNKLRRENKSVVFVNGYFDLIHIGHIIFLREAKKQGDILIVGLNSDSSTRENKGEGRPLMRQEERSLILSALEFVDYVTVFNELTPIKLLTKLTPDILVKGCNYRETEILGKDIVEEYGGKIVRIPLLTGKSTDKIISIINLMRKK